MCSSAWHGPRLRRAVSDNAAFSKDNTYSSTAGDTATLRVNGNRVVLYGVQDPSHGSAAISVDGGPEQTVSFQASTRRGNVALYHSGLLTQGEHTVRVRVVGNGAVSLDRAIVVSAAPAVVSPAAPATGGGGHSPRSNAPNSAEIEDLVGRLGEIVNTLRIADPRDKAEVYHHLGLYLRYDPDRNRVRAEARIGSTRGGKVRVGGGT